MCGEYYAYLNGLKKSSLSSREKYQPFRQFHYIMPQFPSSASSGPIWEDCLLHRNLVTGKIWMWLRALEVPPDGRLTEHVLLESSYIFTNDWRDKFLSKIVLWWQISQAERERLPFVFKEMLTIVKEWNPLPRKKLIIISSIVLRKRILSEHIFFAMLDLEQRASLSSMFIQWYLWHSWCRRV